MSGLGIYGDHINGRRMSATKRRSIMSKKRIVIATLLILIAASFVATATACNRGVRVGDLQTKSETVELDDADSVNVAIQMGAGELDVTGGASELLEATYTYNVEELNPQATFANGRLEVKHSDVDEGIASLFDLGEYRNEWDLKLNEDVPMEMTIDLGAGRSNLTLGALSLSTLNIHGGAGDIELNLNNSQSLSQLAVDIGAGETTIDLTGDWQNDLNARIAGGVGQLNLRLPSEVGVMIEAETGVGDVNTTGLTRDGNTYTNDAYGVSDVTLRVDIDGGVGQINLEAE
jgi:hypothetical protein